MPSEQAFLLVTYDSEGDVLYISARQEPATKGIEDRCGILWRYDNSGALIGATVLDFNAFWWSDRRAKLTKHLSSAFAMPEMDVRALVDVHGGDDGEQPDGK